MNRAADDPWRLHRLSRRSLVTGALVAGSALAISIRQAIAFAPGDPVVTSDEVNLRSGPGLRFSVIQVLPAGTSAVINGIPDPNGSDGYTWYGITLADNTSGFVAEDFLAPANSGLNFPLGSQVIVTTDALNVRSLAGLDPAVNGVVYYGTVGFVESAPIPGDGYWWIDVDFLEVHGWVVTDYIQAYSSSGDKFNIGEPVYVASGPLNFRSSPSLSAAILEMLSTGDAGSVTGGPVSADGYTWYELEFDESGWAVQDFLSHNPPTGDVQVGDTIRVVDGPLNIRSGPGSIYGVIDIAATGATATVVDGPTIADGYTWIEIKGNLLAVGWVAYQFCTVV